MIEERENGSPEISRMEKKMKMKMKKRSEREKMQRKMQVEL